MKIIDYNQYISEKMKVMPITNNEFDRVLGLYEMEEIKNPTFEDICTPGNVVCIDIVPDCEHHGIAMKWERLCKIKQFKYSEQDIIDEFEQDDVLLTIDKNRNITYWFCSYFKQKFPYGNDEETLIKNVFKTDMDVSKLNSKDDVVKIYTDYDLKKIF